MQLNDLFKPETWQAYFSDFVAWFEVQVLALDSLIQLGILLLAALIGYAIQKPLKPRLSDRISK